MAKKAEATSIAPETLSLFENLVATVPGLERKGVTVPYTSLNGHMFAYITKEGDFALRLAKDELAAFISKYKTAHPVSYGATMKDYAVVPPKLLKKTTELAPYFARSYEYIGTLKPKPTKRAK